MSFASVRPYFRTQLEALGYVEHVDHFDFQTIPDDLVDDIFQIESGPATTLSQNQNTPDFDYEIIVRIAKVDFNNTSEANDEIDVEIDSLLTAFLDSTKIYSEAFKRININTITRSPFDSSNSNIVVVEFSFSVTFTKCF